MKKINVYKLSPLIPILTALVLIKPSVIRLLFCLFGIGLFVYIYFRHKSKRLIPFILLASLVGMIIIDGFFSLAFKRIPIFSYNIISLGNVRVYNSVGLRAWQCDKDNYKDIKVSFFDQQGYVCDIDNLAVVYSNSFLSAVVENYSEYKNQYVKINGKISKKNGLNYIEMQAYNANSEVLNGHVEFYDNITLRILFPEEQEELDNYDVYDNITVIGVIKNMESYNNNYVIYMYESKIASIKNLTDFNISVTPESKCNDKISIYNDINNNIYQYCLLNVVVTYSDESKYDLSTVLSSGKLNINNLIDGYKEKIDSGSDNSSIYRFDNYSVLVCDESISKDVIIGTNKLSFNDVSCDYKN